HHRGCSRRRGRKGLRGRSVRSESPGRSDRQGDRRDRRADRVCAGLYERRHPGDREIGSTIATINTISASIAAAVKAQSEVTTHMAQNMTVAAEGVDAISQSMNAIANSTSKIDMATKKVR